MTFSKRIVSIYTSLILLPLLFSIIIFSSNLKKNQIEDARILNETSVSEQTQFINKNIDIIGQLESVTNANQEFISFLATTTEPLSTSQIENFKAESDFLSRLHLALPDIYALRLFIDNDNIPESWPVIINSKRFDTSSLDKWEFNFVADFMGKFNQYMESSVCLTKPLTYRKNKFGSIQITMKMTNFFSFLYQKENPQINKYAFTIEGDSFIPIVDSTINAINPPFTKDELTLLEMFFKDSNKTSSSFTMQTSNGPSIISFSYISRMNLLLINEYMLTDLNRQFFWTKCFAILTLILIGFLLYFVIRFSTMRLMNRVFVLMNGLKEVGKGNLDIQLKVDGSDEVAEAQHAYNKMIEKLKLQIKQIEQEQELAADTEVKAMQNQINAHFLYNVLETIKMQAVLNDQDDIAESLTVLGKMMRYCLRWRIHKVSLQQEIDYVLSYVYILNLRNDYILDLQVVVNPDFLNVEIPKMVLQPIIENSFIHAIEPFGKDAKIKLFTKIDQEKKILYLCAKDFGPGIPQEKLDSIREYLNNSDFERNTKGSIGLKNIQQRLEMFYGKDFKITIESEINKGTLICIPVPYTEDE